MTGIAPKNSLIVNSLHNNLPNGASYRLNEPIEFEHSCSKLSEITFTLVIQDSQYIHRHHNATTLVLLDIE